MALLLNRKYGSRLECLYYIIQSRYHKFGTENEFALDDLKYDSADHENVHNYCKLLTSCIGIDCCPFLDNPLNASKCYATQSVHSDTTKSKAVSDIGGSLEALGFIKRVSKRHYKITESGEKWALSDFLSEEWEKIALKGVLSYGVVIGFLSKLQDEEDIFSYSGIYLSYPKTEELAEYTNDSGVTRILNLSTDSQRDSNTRTISRIIGWCVSTGLLYPQTNRIDVTQTLPHLKYRDFLNANRLTVRKYEKSIITKTIFNEKRYVENPLSFSRLHKNVGSLRENGSEDLRNVTLKYNPRILNRRYTFVKALNHCSKKNQNLDFEKLVDIMGKYKEYYFIDGNDFFDVMSSESEIADITGIPFISLEDGKLKPLTIINDAVLDEEATEEAKNITERVLEEFML